MTALLKTPASPADGEYFRRTAAFAHKGVTGGYADWRHPLLRDPDCMVVVDTALTDRTRLEQELYGAPRPLAVPAEVVLHAYRQWGANLAAQLRGGFSIAIWDAVLQRLLMIRDPLGIRNIFFVDHVGGSAFATQAAALSAQPVSASVEHEALNQLNGVRPTCAPGYGAFRKVQQVRPGELVQVTRESICRGWY